MKAPPAGGPRYSRLIGSYGTGRPGPTLFVCGGMHGNEPAGAEAARRVAQKLEQRRPPLRGEFVAVAGNLGALAQERRYLDVDLNRCWKSKRVADLRARSLAGDERHEDEEQRAILEHFDEAVTRSRGGGVFVIDLHTTSGGGAPFSLMSDTLANRRLAFALPIPVLLGLEESIDGTLLDFMTVNGHTAIAVEGGQHEDTASIDHHEAVIWLSLVSCGALDPDDVPDYAAQREVLARVARGLPRVVEIRHRHAVKAGDGFRMEPGFEGFLPVKAGTLLARDRRGDICASESTLLLMPLYQDDGEDGFFLGRAISPFWLSVAAGLRRMGARKLVRFLPGVTRHPTRPDSYVVQTKIARLFAVEVFHLLGYRRRRREGALLVFSRRRPPD